MFQDIEPLINFAGYPEEGMLAVVQKIVTFMGANVEGVTPVKEVKDSIMRLTEVNFRK